IYALKTQRQSHDMTFAKHKHAHTQIIQWGALKALSFSLSNTHTHTNTHTRTFSLSLSRSLSLSFVRVCAHTTFFLHFFPDPSPPFDKPTHSLPPFLSFSLSFCLTHTRTHFPFLFSPL